MKKNFISLATLAIVMMGCQKNETFYNEPGQKKDGVIKFGVITPKTKALPFGGTADFLVNNQKFNIVGRLDNGSYYLGSNSSAVEVVYNKTTNEWHYPGVKFWPDNSLDFFAWKDGKTGTATPTYSQSGTNTISFTDYAVANTVAEQQDLLVAADTYNRPTIVEQTVLTFKHALTQVVFSAQLYADAVHPAPSVSVRIDEVAIVNVASQGDLTVSPFGYTASGNYPAGGNQNDPAGGRPTATSSITWSDQAAVTTFAVTGLSANVTALSTNLPGLNLTPLTNNTSNAMLMVPQTFNAWNYSKPLADGGAYIRVKALIKDVATDTELWGDGGASKELYIPVSSQSGMYGEWVWGRKINYVIVFGDPNSGSGGGGWGGDGDDPVLVPIRLEAQLTDWDTYDAYIQATNFSGSTANAQGLADQFITEVNNNPAKKYTANFAFTGSATALTINWNLINADRLNVGTKIIIDLTSASDQPANDSAFKPAIVVAGHSWVPTLAGNVHTYVLTKD